MDPDVSGNMEGKVSGREMQGCVESAVAARRSAAPGDIAVQILVGKDGVQASLYLGRTDHMMDENDMDPRLVRLP
jgi:hypothetical protein